MKTTSPAFHRGPGRCSTVCKECLVGTAGICNITNGLMKWAGTQPGEEGDAEKGAMQVTRKGTHSPVCSALTTGWIHLDHVPIWSCLDEPVNNTMPSERSYCTIKLML